MKKRITLKPATMDDAAILLQWRNDSETRKASHDEEEIDEFDHITFWLPKILKNPNRKLFIAWEKITNNDDLEYDKISIVQPIGTVRIDYNIIQNDYELSWTVAPEARGKDIGRSIVTMVASQYKDKNIRAEIRWDNIASIKIAEYIGMKIKRHYGKDEIFYYFREGKPNG